MFFLFVSCQPDSSKSSSVLTRTPFDEPKVGGDNVTVFAARTTSSSPQVSTDGDTLGPISSSSSSVEASEDIGYTLTQISNITDSRPTGHKGILFVFIILAIVLVIIILIYVFFSISLYGFVSGQRSLDGWFFRVSYKEFISEIKLIFILYRKEPIYLTTTSLWWAFTFSQRNLEMPSLNQLHLRIS